VAAALTALHGYEHRRTGEACRRIARELFGSEGKSLLNRITIALRDIEADVWLRAALPDCLPERPIVFDSMRFPEDYAYLKQRGFVLWRVEAPRELRIERLSHRGQDFDPAVDDDHPAEVSLADHAFDVTIVNDTDSLEALRRTVELQLAER
jgi:dephospho-CoA kinase